MHLAAFLIAGPVAHSHAQWRYPEADLGFLEPEYYQRLGTILEAGKFDLAFFADRLALSDRYGRTLEVGLKYGDQDSTRLDPIPILAMMAAATRALGLGSTRSTTYNEPYHIARTFATLDHLSRGRAAWNVVTSMNDCEAQNFGAPDLLEHDLRYDRADEFMELAFKLWDSWDEDALVLDQAGGIYADPAKVRYVDHAGRWFRSRGPLNVPRSPQGRPVIIQAGSSARGKAFTARWSDIVFTIQPTVPLMQRFYADVKTAVEENGRRPSDCKILVAFMPFVGRTEAEAIAKRDRHNELVHPLVGLSTLSNHANYDFSHHALDAPFEVSDVRGTQGLMATVLGIARSEGLTLEDVGKRYGASVFLPQIAGTPAQIADYMQHIVEARGADGFVISAAPIPTGFAEFVEHVVPELQRRGIYRREYTGTQLRDHLANPVEAAGRV